MEDATTIFIKGMVCDRCKRVLTRSFTDLGLIVKEIHLGSVTLAGTSRLPSLAPIQQVLAENGFELLQDRNSKVVQEIKDLIEVVLKEPEDYEVPVKFSRLLQEKLSMEYNTLSALFSATEGITLEKYIINRRLEKVKEWLVYTDLTLTDIAYLIGFSSVQHLSNQFKELTGFTPSHFREIKLKKHRWTDQEVEL